MTISYSAEKKISSAQFIDVLVRSTLGERRPIHDAAVIGSMLSHANLLCTAWEGERLIGVARSLTDFRFCCYLSDLAVDVSYQRSGVGTQLIRLTQQQLDPLCKLILLAAPDAEGYYPKIGFEAHRSAWVARADSPMGRPNPKRDQS